ncbi:hypothetical protein [Flavobacterium sp. DG2-3]|uniref:hypothetical protein n=1 Tax=Flavobacterium sp. DG2-3 TaxID=3068317 RepID=UPI00273DBC97|nr:hypothetical protein [Flavobacterium sp. DG2-3]MDP5199006.1 hypothetical protein [Flavobacterium sp. DG2-3]
MMNKLDFSKIGFDYGLKPHLMLVGDPEFSKLFLAGKCIGLCYEFSKDKEDLIKPESLSFIFENEKPAEDFFKILLNWIDKSNGDGNAVAMDFIETDEGGYTLGISPDRKRFIDRMVPKSHKEKVSPVAMLFTQFKEIPTLSKSYLDFKNNINNIDNLCIGYVIAKGEKIIKKGEKHFFKTEFNFYEENNISEDNMAAVYHAVKKQSDLVKKPRPKPTEHLVQELGKRRLLEMKSYLPLTLNRLQNKWLEIIIEKLEKEYEKDQIVQAICNLTIFERLKQNVDLSSDFTGQGYPNRILDYLLFTFESFDSYYPDDDFYTEERIIQQIQNDKNELTQYFNKP